MRKDLANYLKKNLLKFMASVKSLHLNPTGVLTVIIKVKGNKHI